MRLAGIPLALVGGAEANPLMWGGWTQGVTAKTALGAATVLAVRGMDRKNRKAAIVTMIAANAVTVAVAAHDLRVHQRPRQTAGCLTSIRSRYINYGYL